MPKRKRQSKPEVKKSFEAYLNAHSPEMAEEDKYWQDRTDPNPPVAAQPFDPEDPLGLLSIGSDDERSVSRMEASFNIIRADLLRSSEEGNAAAFSIRLQIFLDYHSIPIPPGVFEFTLIGPKRGRPRADPFTLCNAILAYKTHGSYAKAAKALYPEEFKTDRKRATDKVRLLIASIEPIESE